MDNDPELEHNYVGRLLYITVKNRHMLAPSKPDCPSPSCDARLITYLSCFAAISV